MRSAILGLALCLLGTAAIAADYPPPRRDE